MRILVADDDPVLQAIVSTVLAAEGYEILQARDGLEALALYQAQAPDIILTDFEMPGLNGLELARRILGGAAGAFVPILLFTGADQPGLLKESLRVGILEFLTKPFEPDELRCRVNAIAQLTSLHKDLVAQKTEDDEELALVKHVLARIVEAGNRSQPAGFWMETLQTRRINGDACAYRRGADGVHFAILCDATGHGLVAGVSTIPVLEVFLGCVARNASLAAMYRAIHARLVHILPTGRFACLTLLRLDAPRGELEVLNAGMPDVMVLRTSGEVALLPSQTLPAGIRGVKPDVAPVRLAVAPGDRILAFSDGLLDVAPLEILRVELVEVPGGLSHHGHCQAIQHWLDLRVGSSERHDDVTWALWEVPGGVFRARRCGAGASAPLTRCFSSSFVLEAGYPGLRIFVPTFLSHLAGMGIAPDRLELLGLLLTEALANALEHGVLHLDSRLKEESFEAYLALRQTRIREDASAGLIRLELSAWRDEALPGGPVRSLRVEVEDSGRGFSWRSWLQDGTPSLTLPHGRGIALLRALSRDLHYNESGNTLVFTLDCPPGEEGVEGGAPGPGQ